MVKIYDFFSNRKIESISEENNQNENAFSKQNDAVRRHFSVQSNLQATKGVKRLQYQTFNAVIETLRNEAYSDIGADKVPNGLMSPFQKAEAISKRSFGLIELNGSPVEKVVWSINYETKMITLSTLNEFIEFINSMR